MLFRYKDNLACGHSRLDGLLVLPVLAVDSDAVQRSVYLVADVDVFGHRVDLDKART